MAKARKSVARKTRKIATVCSVDGAIRAYGGVNTEDCVR